MAERKKNIRLTNDPLTNIHIMVSMLDDRARERFSDMMFGSFIGEEIAEEKKKKELQEV